MNQMALPLVEQLLLLQAGFSIERQTSPDGEHFLLHFDMPMGNVAKRYTITFDHNGFDSFLKQCQGAKSGLEVASAIPKIGAGERIH